MGFEIEFLVEKLWNILKSSKAYNHLGRIPKSNARWTGFFDLPAHLLLTFGETVPPRRRVTGSGQ